MIRGDLAAVAVWGFMGKLLIVIISLVAGSTLLMQSILLSLYLVVDV